MIFVKLIFDINQIFKIISRMLYIDGNIKLIISIFFLNIFNSVARCRFFI